MNFVHRHGTGFGRSVSGLFALYEFRSRFLYGLDDFRCRCNHHGGYFDLGFGRYFLNGRSLLRFSLRFYSCGFLCLARVINRESHLLLQTPLSLLNGQVFDVQQRLDAINERNIRSVVHMLRFGVIRCQLRKMQLPIAQDVRSKATLGRNFLQRIKTTGLIVVAHLNFLSFRR